MAPCTTATVFPAMSSRLFAVELLGTSSREPDMKYGSENSTTWRRSSVMVTVAMTMSILPDCRNGIRLPDVTATSSTCCSSLKSAFAKRWATSTSKPTFLPELSTVPNGGKSVFTPATSLPRFFTVSSVDWAQAVVAMPTASTSMTATTASMRDLIGVLPGDIAIDERAG